MDHLSFPLLPHILDTKFKDSLATLEVKITDKSGKIRTITKTPFEKRLQDISTPDILTPDFSNMNSSTPDPYGVEKFMVEKSRVEPIK